MEASDYAKFSRKDLIEICKEYHIGGYSGKKKGELVALLVASYNKIKNHMRLVAEAEEECDKYAVTVHLPAQTP